MKDWPNVEDVEIMIRPHHAWMVSILPVVSVNEKAQVAKDEPVRHIRFRGLTFMHGDSCRLTEDDAGLQHDWNMYERDNALVRLQAPLNQELFQRRGAAGQRGHFLIYKPVHKFEKRMPKHLPCANWRF